VCIAVNDRKGKSVITIIALQSLDCLRTFCPEEMDTVSMFDCIYSFFSARVNLLFSDCTVARLCCFEFSIVSS